MSNLINAERVTMSYGTRTLLDDLSLGPGPRRRGGVVGRNGAGKTTLLRVLAGTLTADSGRVTHTAQLSIGFWIRSTTRRPTSPFEISSSPARQITCGQLILVRERSSRHLLADVDLGHLMDSLSGGERRGRHSSNCCLLIMIC
jgi:ABC-type Mn2+/Zn2+ transport system ATPase subunit